MSSTISPFIKVKSTGFRYKGGCLTRPPINS